MFVIRDCTLINLLKMSAPANSPFNKVALIHDWLTGMRGGEMVLEEFCRLFPDADIFTLAHQRGSVSELIENRRIIQSPIVKLPFGGEQFRRYLPLFPWAIEAFDLRGYDFILSDSHCVAKGVIPPPDALHIAYIHSPMRYVWDIRTDYLGPAQFGRLGRLAAGWAAHYLRNWDSLSSARVDQFIANSEHIRLRICKYYRREAAVIHPPVDIERYTIGGSTGDYFITVSALAPYKRVDLAVKACSRLGLKLKVIGDGPEYKKLKAVSGKTVEFVGHLSRPQMVEVYQNCLALIHCAEEDFGIAPVEAQACGRPVIAYGRGGALETVIGSGDCRTGLFFNEQTPEALSAALRHFPSERFDAETIRRNAERFSRQVFIDKITNFIQKVWVRQTSQTGAG